MQALPALRKATFLYDNLEEPLSILRIFFKRHELLFLVLLVNGEPCKLSGDSFNDMIRLEQFSHALLKGISRLVGIDDVLRGNIESPDYRVLCPFLRSAGHGKP